jgi:hypothetical protein
VLAAGACAQRSSLDTVGTIEQRSALAASFQILLPTGDPRPAIISASSTVTIDDRVTIGTSAALESVSSFGTPQTSIASAVQAHANVISQGPVFLASQATVQGFVKSGAKVTRQDNSVVVGGGSTDNAAITGVPVSWNVTFPDTNQGDVFIPPDQPVRALSPGSWGSLNIQSRSSVSLTAGTYFFLSISTEPQAQILLDKSAGPIVIYVKSAFSLKGPFVTSAGPEGEELVGYLGTSTAYLEVPLLGTIVAPSATIELRRPSNNAPHRGAAFGLGVHVFSDATVIRVPFSWGFLCPAGDSDGDGVFDCTDFCPYDPAKTAPKICGCGVAETDDDHDGIPNCVDVCPQDPRNGSIGQCGCAGATAKAGGTQCTDSPCPLPAGGTFNCDGLGTCGTPNTCAPAAGCTLRRFQQSWYWFCPGPVTWAQAAQACRAQAGRSLLRINTQLENDFVSGVLQGTSWMGANDQTTAGTWRWSTSTSNDGDQFWSGGPTGSPVGKLFNAWSASQPDPAGTCADVAQGGGWASAACTQTLGYVCEQTVAMPGVPVPPFHIGSFPTGGSGNGNGGGSGFGNNGAPPPCIPASQAFGTDPIGDLNRCQNQALSAPATCNDTVQDAACRAACTGAASIPTGNTCPAFEDEERAACELTNVQTNGCDPNGDCCSITVTPFIASEVDPPFGDALPEGFEGGAAGFVYVDDGFQQGGPARPASENGMRLTTGGNPGAALQIFLGDVTNNLVTNLSGAWQLSFSLPQQAMVGVSFDYNLTQSPNYESNEFSRVLLSIDGKLLGAGSNNFIDQVAGDGDGGPSITTGWKTFRRNLGILAAGTHTLRIGGFNNQKNASNESTTILIDNVLAQVRTDTCGGNGFICAPSNQPACEGCDQFDASGNCITPHKCPPAVLRCGQPNHIGAPDGNCSNDAMFNGTTRCAQVEVCPDANATGSSDPTVGGGLSQDPPFDPVKVFGTPVAATPGYPDDPPCAGTGPCHAGAANRWCSYNVATWFDPAVTNGPKSTPVPNKSTPSGTKEGNSGGGIVHFKFDPDVVLSYQINQPLPFGEANFTLDASASLSAVVGVTLPGVPPIDTTIVDALMDVHEDRCGGSDQGHLLIFDKNFFPSTTLGGGFNACGPVITDYELATNRVKKAYRDAVELINQYQKHQLPPDFCQKMLSDPPRNFPPGNCATDNIPTTINRFIRFYRDEIKRYLQPAASEMAFMAMPSIPFPAPPADLSTVLPAPARESDTLVETTFPIGPIPLLLEVEGFVEYGLAGSLEFAIHPIGPTPISAEQSFATVEGHLGPYALAGLTMFVGVGFDFGAFSASAGIEGSITLGRIGVDAHAGAGISVTATPDTRPLPDDIKNAAVPAAITTGTVPTLFPNNGARQYEYAMSYDYGLTINLTEILAGQISGRVRVKIAFFSKTWRKTLLTFPGFSAPPLPLLSGGGDVTAFNPEGAAWGTVQMPLPFVDLQDLDASNPVSQNASAFDASRVEQLFYDSLCQCSQDGAGCFRNGDCCNRPTSICFSDPALAGNQGGNKVCSGCRKLLQSCNVDADCCSGPSQGASNDPITCVQIVGAKFRTCQFASPP